MNMPSIPAEGDLSMLEEVPINQQKISIYYGPYCPICGCSISDDSYSDCNCFVEIHYGKD